MLDEQAAVAEALDEQLAGKPMKFQARHLEGKLQSLNMHAFVCKTKPLLREACVCIIVMYLLK